MMRKNPKSRCIKRTLMKSAGICRLYSKLQEMYLDKLDQDNDILIVRCNVDVDGTDFTTDFYCKRTNGTFMVRECVEKRHLTKPLTLAHLEESRSYWNRHGVTDWGIVTNKEVADA